MIIDFFGLPGCGKTTLETYLYQINQDIVSRDQLVDSFIKHYYTQHYSSTFFARRFITLLYIIGVYLRLIKNKGIFKTALKGLTRKPARLSLFWLQQDVDLIKFISENLPKNQVYNLQEGLSQHIAASIIWSHIPQEQINNYLKQSFKGISLQTYISLEIVQLHHPSFQSFIKRGIPNTWPKEVDVRKTFSQFKTALSTSKDLLKKFNFVKLTKINLPHKMEELPSTAQRINKKITTNCRQYGDNAH